MRYFFTYDTLKNLLTMTSKSSGGDKTYLTFTYDSSNHMTSFNETIISSGATTTTIVHDTVYNSKGVTSFELYQ